MQYIERFNGITRQNFEANPLLYFGDYIPLCLVNNLYRTNIYGSYSPEEHNIIRQLSSNILGRNNYPTSPDNIKIHRKVIWDYLEQWKEQSSFEMNIFNNNEIRTYLFTIRDYCKSNRSCSLRVRNYNNYTWFNTDLLFLANRGNIPNIFFTMVIHRKYLKYYRLSILLEEDIDLGIFEFWIRKDIDITRTPNIKVRNIYRKNFKDDLIDRGIKIVLKDNIEKDLFQSFELPKNIQTIDNYKDYMNDLSKRFCESIKKSF